MRPQQHGQRLPWVLALQRVLHRVGARALGVEGALPQLHDLQPGERIVRRGGRLREAVRRCPAAAHPRVEPERAEGGGRDPGDGGAA